MRTSTHAVIETTLFSMNDFMRPHMLKFIYLWWCIWKIVEHQSTNQSVKKSWGTGHQHRFLFLFHSVPECQKRGLDKNEIQAFLSPQITSRHCSDLIDAAMEFRKKHPLATTFFSSKNIDVWIDNIIQENRTALFDSHQMIGDWWAERNCSNYEKRCRLQRAANVPKGRTDDIGKVSFEYTFKSRALLPFSKLRSGIKVDICFWSMVCHVMRLIDWLQRTCDDIYSFWRRVQDLFDFDQFPISLKSRSSWARSPLPLFCLYKSR